MKPRPVWPSADPDVEARSFDADHVHLWWMDLSEPVRPFDELLSWLDEAERERAARFRFDVHRLRYVAAHGQMRALLGAYLGVPAGALRFAQEPRGKPHLARPAAADTGAPDLEFSLSHSEDQGLLAIARTGPLGANIEVQRPLSDLEALARSHFARAELAELFALPVDRHHDAFFAAWTRKEAYVKALGAGLAVPLDSFEVALHPDAPASLRSIGGSPEAARAWTLWAARPAPRSWAAVTVRMPAARVRTFSLHESALP